MKNESFPTPIWDFVRKYRESGISRLHMPGHKGKMFLGCEPFDITEIGGADALYEAEGIIAESESYATKLFGTAGTFYSTEGSSQCIRAMLALALSHWRRRGNVSRPVVVAARNVHKAFLHAATLLDFDVKWLWPEATSDSVCSCPITPQSLQKTLSECETPPAAVYLTSPDYLGGMAQIPALSAICKEHETLLLVDNAHGAYLHFLEKSLHPMDLGADLCCDSAHKTLPALTGAAYLHISHRVSELAGEAKQAMVLFGSTSPSYLTLSSLDLCNRYLATGYRESLKEAIGRVEQLKERLRTAGFSILESDPLRLTVDAPKQAQTLLSSCREAMAECEFADEDYLVMMFTPENDPVDYERAERGLLAGKCRKVDDVSARTPLPKSRPEQVCSIREAMLSVQKSISTREALGVICAAPTVSCPPAIPIVMPGERIGAEEIALFLQYGMETVRVML